MAGVAKQIIGSFEDIGKDVIREAAKVPADIAGKALESLGTSSQKGQKGNSVAAAQATGVKQSEGALGQLDQTTDKKARAAIAREALSQIAGNPQKQKEPTVQERLEKEREEKNEKEGKQATVAQKMAPISTGSSKPRRGNLYGVKQKSTSIENKGSRQD